MIRKHAVKIVTYILFLAVVILIYQPLLKLDDNYIVVTNGAADLSGFDFSKTRARVYAQGWEYYPERLYTPQDFQTGSIAAPIYENNVNSAAYGTYRVILLLPPGKTYGMTGRSFLYSTNIYINGELAGEIGSPGETVETTTPRTNTYAFYFTPQSDSTEIIFQVANFQMKDGGGSFSFSLGEAGLVEQYRLTRLTGGIVVVGGLITIALLFFGMFIFFTKRRYFLYYALLILMIATRVMLTGDKPIMEFLPSLDWYLSIRTEYLNVILILVFAIVYLYTLYPKLIGKPVLITALCLSALYGGLVLFTDPMFFSAINIYFYILCGAAGLYSLIRLGLGLRKGGMERALVFIGLLLFLLAAINDLIQYSFHTFMWLYDAISVGMLAFVYMNMIALFIGLSKTEAALYESDRKAEMLDAKTALYTQINHDIRTPLTVISNYAQMVMEQLAEGGADEQTVADLNTIRNEAGRLAEMASNTLRSSESGNKPEPLDISVIARQIREVFTGQLKFSGRGFTAEIPEKLPPVWSSADDITRLLWNLLDNAMKHNEQGGITLRAASDGETVTVTVADDGEGIAPELLPRLFTRGVSGTDGTGLGLSICQEIARKYHGDVTVRSESGKGTVAALTLPVFHTEDGV